MIQFSRNDLNSLYRPLDQKAREFIANFVKLHGGFRVTSGFFNGHFHKNEAGNYQEDAYPIPVISVMGLCDIEIDFDAITFTTKLKKGQIADFDWRKLGGVPFEVYGVEDYLSDYGSSQNSAQIKDGVSGSKETEFFVSFSFPIETDGEQAFRFLRTLQKYGFYY